MANSIPPLPQFPMPVPGTGGLPNPIPDPRYLPLRHVTLTTPDGGQDEFYTADLAEYTAVVTRLSFTDRGVAGYVFSQEGGASPIYRLYNPATGRHYYTIDAQDRNDQQAAGFTYEGVAGYVGGPPATKDSVTFLVTTVTISVTANGNMQGQASASVAVVRSNP